MQKRSFVGFSPRKGGTLDVIACYRDSTRLRAGVKVHAAGTVLSVVSVGGSRFQ